MSDNALSVSALNNFIRDVIKSGFPQGIWVCGEIQELREKSGHLYFNLVEKDPQTHAVLAKIGVSIWANSRFKIEAILAKSENPFQLKDDIQVSLLCKVDFYPPFGQVRLIAESVDPVYTLGKIAQDRLKIIAQLTKEGVLDRNKQLPFPLIALNIGLITSVDSAAYHDFIDELRKSHYGFRIKVVDSIMQGKNTDSSIVNALKSLSTHPVDMIVICRGGGSVADLSAFDSVAIAKAIAGSSVPVITGIGHEINTTIADLAANRFAKTPTAVAQLLIRLVDEYLSELNERQANLVKLASDMVRFNKEHLVSQALSLKGQTQDYLKTHQHQLLSFREALMRQPKAQLEVQRQLVKDRLGSLKKTIQLNLTQGQTKIQAYQRMVDIVNPINTLKRGFTITRNDKGEVIKSVDQAKRAKKLVTSFVDGEVDLYHA